MTTRPLDPGTTSRRVIRDLWRLRWVALALGLVGGFVYWPIFDNFRVSLTHQDIFTGETEFVGLGKSAELLARNGLTLDDIDLVEIHEAFAATVLATVRQLEADGHGVVGPDRLNVNGSSLAAGHPFAATGGRIVATLAKLLAERGPGTRGLISICAAGGQAVTAILEAV